MAKKTTEDQPMFDQKAYNKTVRALIKDNKKAGSITYDDLRSLRLDKFANLTVVV